VGWVHYTDLTGYLGFKLAAAGTATIIGSGSKSTNSDGLYVGNSGSGTLNVQAGGQVSSSFGCLGYGSGTTGAATITGSGSTWTINNAVDVGGNGRGMLIVAAGGVVSNANGYLGSNSVATGLATIYAHCRGDLERHRLTLRAIRSTWRSLSTKGYLATTCTFGNGTALLGAVSPPGI
jgi:T5SS/PEP-CTERM-associated repeat protein